MNSKLVRPNLTRFFLGWTLDPKFSWPQILFKFGFNPIMYLINPNEPDLNPILGRVGSQGPNSDYSKFPTGPNQQKFKSLT